ncbi:MAG: DUF2868 domain-containing protein [Pseudomonadota bacterium]
MPRIKPKLSALYHLAEQLQGDRDTPEPIARARDHAMAAECAGDDVDRLLKWSQQMDKASSPVATVRDSWMRGSFGVALARVIATVLGFSAMAGFLLSSERGLVNVFLFVLLFVIVQLFMCLLGIAVMARNLFGSQPPVLPTNPARFLIERSVPDGRDLDEAQSALRLLFLRFGQELGALFTLGAIAAFFIVLAMSDFTFVWGSTFAVSDSAVETMTASMALPWSAWLPQATVDSDLIFVSRFHPAVSSIGPSNIEAMRGWWPFLVMTLVVYALIPRILLWCLSMWLYGRELRVAILALPGASRVLSRMRAPIVATQGERERPDGQSKASTPRSIDRRILLLNWANALKADEIDSFVEFQVLADGHCVNAGSGSLDAELKRAAAMLASPVDHLYVAVKSWEPPMADLADFLSKLSKASRCTLFLVPLAARPVSATSVSDWQHFARGLRFASVDVQRLERA